MPVGVLTAFFQSSSLLLLLDLDGVPFPSTWLGLNPARVVAAIWEVKQQIENLCFSMGWKAVEEGPKVWDPTPVWETRKKEEAPGS